MPAKDRSKDRSPSPAAQIDDEEKKLGVSISEPFFRFDASILLSHRPRQISLLIVLGQVISVAVVLGFFGDLLRISSYGASALISTALCGFSQGFIQFAAGKRPSVDIILKFYAWGVCNGIWTVSFDS